MRKSINKNTERQILDLFFNSDDNRLLSIANVINFSLMPVSVVIEKHSKGRIKYEKPDYKIYHSKMNYESRM
jgi:hypothetical protein